MDGGNGSRPAITRDAGTPAAHRRGADAPLLGILYEQVTEYLGFLHSSDEYKVMALASYGEPVHVDAFRGIVHRGRDGFYTIEPPCLEQRFGPPAPVADRWTNTTSISPTRCKSS